VLPRSVNATRYLTQLLRVGLISGIVVSAVAFPVVAIAGLGVLAATDYVDKLPTDLRDTPSAQVSYVYASDGTTLLTQFYEEYRRYVPLSDISPNMQRAIVASEDSRFYDHHGVDTRGVLRAFLANQSGGGVSQGASTLTMQYVRNMQQNSAETPQQVQEATRPTAASCARCDWRSRSRRR
jgi:membrane peptidoglycan carboxypeptidase